MEKLLLIEIIHLFCTIFKIQQAVCLPRCIWRPHWRRPTRISSRYLAWDTTRPTALARRSRPGSLQASSDSSPVSERPRTTVSVAALHPGLQCCHAAASAFRQPSSTCRTAFPAQHLRRRVFSVAGPMADFIRDPTSSTDCLGVYFKRTCSRVTLHPAHFIFIYWIRTVCSTRVQIYNEHIKQ